MSSKKCIVCLRAAVDQVEFDPKSLSLPLFLDYLGPTLEASGKLNYSSNDTTSTLACCTCCQVVLARVIKLNAKLNTLVSKVKQSCVATKTRTLLNVNSDADTGSHSNVIGNTRQYQEVGGLFPVEGTSRDNRAEAFDKSQLTSKDDATAGSVFNVYENSWLPKNVTFPKSPQLFKQISDREFIYLDKYPFQGTEFGFQCGLCSVIVMFCTHKRSFPWYNVVRHVMREHKGNLQEDSPKVSEASAETRLTQEIPSISSKKKARICEYIGCGLTFPNRALMWNHRNGKHKERLCNICKKMFSAQKIGAHRKVCEAQQQKKKLNNSCVNCGVTFVNNNLKKAHTDKQVVLCSCESKISFATRRKSHKRCDTFTVQSCPPVDNFQVFD